MIRNKSFQRSIIIACFFLSGCAGLIYELLWVRTMTLFLGNSQWAISTVVAAFMAGLALGCMGGGWIADKLSKKRLIQLYIGLEVSIAFTGVLSKPLISLVQQITLSAGILTLPIWLKVTIWFILGFLLLLIPTACMGATLPILARWYINTREQIGSVLSLLYAFNTMGAVCGVWISGFFIIERFGLSKSFLIAALINICCALIIGIGFFKNNGKSEELLSHKPQKPSLVSIIMLLLSGSAAMICQITWMRIMILVIGSSTYAFSIILLCFLIGISLGSAVCSRILKHHPASWIGVGFVSAAAGVVILSSLPVFSRLPYLLVKLYPLVFQHVVPLSIIHIFLCGLILFVPTLFMGALFPLVVTAGIRTIESVGFDIGLYSMINIIGNIAGVLAASFLLIPVIGVEKTLIVAIIFYGALSFLAWMYSDYTHKKKTAFAILVVLTLGIMVKPQWDVSSLTSGMFLYAPQYRDVRSFSEFKKRVNQHEVLYHKDGYSSTVTVLHSPWNERFLRINGKTDASWGFDMKTELLLGYMPRLFFSGQPNNALIIGLGAGVTAGATAVDAGIQQIDCVELEPAVAEAAMWFTRVNRWVMKDSRYHLIIADARHYLTGTKTTYDLIISEPSNPWMAGVATLFTEEAFRLVKQKLSDKGVFCQWIHSYAMGEDDFKMILATFVHVFPHSMLLSSQSNDFLLLGSEKPLIYNMNSIETFLEKNPSVAQDLHGMNIGHPFSLIALSYQLETEQIKEYTAGALIHRDDHLKLEFSAPRFLHANEEESIARHIQQAKKTLLPKNRVGFTPAADQLELIYNLTGESFLRSRESPSAQLWFNKASESVPAPSARTITNQARIASLENKDFQAEKLYKQAIAVDQNYPLAYFHLGQLYTIKGLEEKGMRYLEQGMTLSPKDPLGTITLGSLYIKYGRFAEAKKLFEHTLTSSTLQQNVRYKIEQALASVNKELENKSKNN